MAIVENKNKLRRKNEDDNDQEEEVRKRQELKTPAQHQKLKLDKLMKNYHKPVYIPEKSKDHGPRKPPEFVIYCKGSSAGADSASFHAYRKAIRREEDRVGLLEEVYQKKELDEEFREKLKKIKEEERLKTLKKRDKRMKRKLKLKEKKKKQNTSLSKATNSSDSSEEEIDNDDKK